MKIKTLSLSIILSLSLFGCSDSGNTSESTSSSETMTKPVKVDNLSVYKNYSDINMNAKNSEIKELIKDSITDYEKLIVLVDTQIEEAKTETTKEFNENIEELKITLQNEMTQYNQDCAEVKASNQDLCNHLGAQNNKLDNQIKSLEVKLINEVKKMDNQKENTLKSYQAKLKTNISKLMSQDD